MTEIFKCLSNEIRLDGKGHLNADFYCQKFENIFLSNKRYKNILLYNVCISSRKLLYIKPSNSI